MKYNHKKIESKWQKKWEQLGIYTPDVLNTKKKDKFYNLFMFPYPSAEGLHVGHAFSSIGSDIYGRFARMTGKTVFQPMGYDSFGIHSENYAIKINENPNSVVKRTTKHYGDQLRALGNGYDWTRTVTTSDPEYYKWTQWLFIEMFKQGLAYRKKAKVNFCPSCKTVLADEQVMSPKQAGKEARTASGESVTGDELRVCERCGTVVEKRSLDQWFFKITDYADRLLEGLEKIDWSKRVVIAQKEWIGKSEGRIIKFKTEGPASKGWSGEGSINVFTTRPDTLNAVTFLATSKLYVEGNKEKIGKFTGYYAVSPLDGRRIPIWDTNYVAPNYGTGVVMGVPAHDERDREFATKYSIDILDKDPEYNDIGKKHTNYHLRDWLVSRQRYWGAPIPMIYCESCASKGPTLKGKSAEGRTLQGNMAGWFVDENLPVLLPEISDYKPEGNGRGPLANHPEFYKTKCPKCGGDARRETDVMDTFVDSSWYFLRYPSVGISDIPDKSEESDNLTVRNSGLSDLSGLSDSLPWNPQISRVWLPVDLYFGGAEHSVLHLMYARFVNMVMHDRGYLDHEEPFPKFFAHGLMIKDGAKMSKSRGNVVNPDEYVEKYGADTLRMYVMFMGPMDGYPDFRDSGIEGMSRFLKRVWNLFNQTSDSGSLLLRVSPKVKTSRSVSADQNFDLNKVESKLHQTIKGVTEDIKQFKYNTSIAKIMELVNVLSIYHIPYTIYREALKVLVQLLAPFAPHMTEELWQVNLKQKGSVHLSLWPKYDQKYLVSNTVTYAIQVNGKLRATLNIEYRISNIEKEVIKLVKSDEKVAKWLEGKKIKKEIFVPNKLLNFVV